MLTIIGLVCPTTYDWLMCFAIFSLMFPHANPTQPPRPTPGGEACQWLEVDGWTGRSQGQGRDDNTLCRDVSGLTKYTVMTLEM